MVAQGEAAEIPQDEPPDATDLRMEAVAEFMHRHPHLTERVLEFNEAWDQARQDIYHIQVARSFLKAIEQDGRLLTIHTETMQIENKSIKFFNIHGASPDGKTVSVPGTDILEALNYFNGDAGEQKKCKKCTLDKPIYLFSRLASKADGRNIYCKQCERDRVRLHNKDRALKRKCQKCKRVKMLNEFPKAPKEAKGRGYYCNQCRRVRKGKK
jgi:hypothetical protein